MKRCKPGHVEFGMFGWLLRLPDGSAARAKNGRNPKYFSSAPQCVTWVRRQRNFIGANQQVWIRCEAA